MTALIMQTGERARLAASVSTGAVEWLSLIRGAAPGSDDVALTPAADHRSFTVQAGRYPCAFTILVVAKVGGQEKTELVSVEVRPKTGTGLVLNQK